MEPWRAVDAYNGGVLAIKEELDQWSKTRISLMSSRI
jgi:hypothetical protein